MELELRLEPLPIRLEVFFPDRDRRFALRLRDLKLLALALQQFDVEERHAQREMQPRDTPLATRNAGDFAITL